MEKVLIKQSEIQQLVKNVAAKIDADYGKQEVVFVCVLKGAFMFFADLIRELKSTVAIIDFVKVSSYGASTDKPGKPELKLSASENVEGKHVVLVDDLIDTGNTLLFLKNEFSKTSARSVKVCTLLDKPTRRVADIEPDYLGKAIEDQFVFGYGIDAGGKGRHLKDVCYKI